ncbi:LysR family transcriptional regulator [Methylobacterium sp. WL30]|uniref:LysR family transcriptional regulator n=1 Tax=unclassified Methylobacterium TaxID=2615210 RepID=UPI0011CC85CF|nr:MULTISPECIES: LysR family transcriptional regulator [unclassified Methylobacterium]MCJ2042078.1 LysR family transcriptional regulator [Methylobacterium sp. J-059]TXM90675.1 LysR family transcriptional regulator [Methylobacterium sp. WL116]TXN40476.1 LysR family transcriptional regulator [Methylobacterium sp. WL93]TXN52315.1 LysR family transcriptional regulator [Methylobacterium sp. WL119]TXN69652.1 LysR family transcriptional regulator [Methylobacterium sp. WL30]
MNISGLRYLLAVARTGSIAAASTHLNIAASAISRQISNLESELGCVLFERRPRGMVLSPAGELLAEHARQTLLRAEQVAADIQELQGLARGFIRVATSEGFALDLLPNAIAEFHAAHPGIRFEVQMLPPAQVTHVVAAGDADIGITFALAPSSLVAVAYDNAVEMVALSAPDHPLARRPAIRLADLKAYPIAVPTLDTTARRVFDAACLAEGITIEPTLTANILSALLPFVRRTKGLALMSALTVQTPVRLGELVCIPVHARMSLMRGIQVQVMRDRKLPHAVQAFLRRLVAALPPTEPGGV